MDLVQFGRALWAHWWTLMSCAVFTLFGIFAAAKQLSSAWIVRSSFIIAAVLVVVAAYLAWSDEHAARLALEERLKSPDFHFSNGTIATTTIKRADLNADG